MSLIHYVIKINYIKAGYLPNYPYHMISDHEMCDAFLNDDNPCFFYDNYPLLDDSLSDAYNKLVEELKYHMNALKSQPDDSYDLPSWVYSYMLGSVVSINSDHYDIQNIADMLNIDIDFGDFNSELSKNCYEVSKEWIQKLSSEEQEHRPPTMFGEPHVIKSLRLKSVQVGSEAV